MKYSNTVLKRLGNKSKLKKQIISNFPFHNFYIEPFFGSGSIYFHKPKAKYNYLNDIDNEVYNLFLVLKDEKKKQKLIEFIKIMPKHNAVLQKLKNKELIAENEIEQAGYFLFLSNYTFLGMMGALKYGQVSNDKHLLDNLELFNSKILFGVHFHNTDVTKFLNAVHYSREETEKRTARELSKIFCYCDPPYLKTAHNYNMNGWSENNLIELIELLISKGIKFAISEFKTETILKIAKKYKLNIVEIGERRTLKSRNTEILLINYKLNKELF